MVSKQGGYEGDAWKEWGGNNGGPISYNILVN